MTSRVLLCAAMLLAAAAAEAQVGIGGRLATVRGDVDAGTSSVRFTGGQLRAGISRRISIELALDTKTETSDDETVRIRQYPFQASLLLSPIKGGFSPFILGGVGWYSTRVETLADSEVLESVTTRRRGYHGGFGAELRLGRHAGLHGDYRYTFLNFDGDDDEDEDDPTFLESLSPGSAVSRLLPSSEGSMWTVGLTIYF